MIKEKKNCDLLLKCLFLGFFTLLILSSASFTFSDGPGRRLPGDDTPGHVEPSAPAVEETFESYVVGSDIHGQGRWLVAKDSDCTATVQTLGMTPDKWLQLYDVNNPNRKVEAVWNFTAIAAAPKIGFIKFNVQTNDATRNTTIMLADLPWSEIIVGPAPQGASELRIINDRFEVHSGNTWSNIRAASDSTTYDVELHYKIGAGAAASGWHVVIDGVKYGGDYTYRFSFAGNPAAMRCFEVMTSRTDNGPYYSYFDDIDCSWTPNDVAPVLSAGSVAPTVGTNQTTQFTYSVTYTDADNNPPQWVNVTLDGSRVFPMTKLNPLDNNYIDGCVYRYQTYLRAGNHSYAFNASDGTRAAGLGPYYGPTAEPQWNQVSLAGVQVGCVVSHGETNPHVQYRIVGNNNDAIDDLRTRGATLSNITTAITAGVLAPYKIVWINEGGTNNWTTAELDAIELWVRNGGSIIVTGNDSSSSHMEYRVLYRFSIYMYSQVSVSGSSNQIYPHPITRNLASIYYYYPARLGLTGQPLASLCGEISGYDTLAAMSYGKGKLVALSDDNTFISYSTANNRYLANNTFGWLGYTPKNDFNPTLTDGSVNPGSGAQNTPFTFRVTYTDADNNPAEYVRVSINGTAWNMTKMNPYDFDFTDGCVYTFTTYLQGPSMYQFVFQGYDGARTGTSITYPGPSVSYTNMFTPSLASPFLFPNRGYNNRTMFNFSVTYMDRDNNAPQYISVWLNSTQYAMVKDDPTDVDYTNGCNYVLRIQIPAAGNYSYSFNASDGGSTPVSQGTFHDLEVEAYEPIYFDGMQYAWRGYFNWTGMVEEGLDEFTLRSGVIHEIDSSPDNSFQGDRVVNASSRLLNETSGDVWSGTHEWTRIFIDVGLGSQVRVSVLSSPEQVFTVAGETYVLAMGRAFECWVLLSPEGSVAYYDKFSGILVNGTFYAQGFRQYSLEARSTNVVLESNSHGPTLTGEGVAPASGTQAIPYTFSVTYTDLDDNAPVRIDVVINGTPHAMQRQNPADTNMSDGCTYQLTTYLQPGSYPWFINCSDGIHAASTGLQPAVVVSWASLSQCTLDSGAVSPKNGFNGSTPFTFEVIYKDADNNQPSSPVTLDVNGTSYTMVKQDPDDDYYVDGCVYACTIYIPVAGIYTYYFYTSDGVFFVSDGPYSDLVVGLTRSMFLDDAWWEWDGYILGPMGGPDNILYMHGVETFNQTSATSFDVTSWPGSPFWASRVIDARNGSITSGSYATGSVEWVKIPNDIKMGSSIPVGVFNTWGTPENFFVTGEATMVAMGRSFSCWVLETGSGRKAYYDKYSGILINITVGDLFGGGFEGYSLHLRNTSYPLQPNAVAPVLSMDQVTPGSGNQLTAFTFKVTYTDADNNMPEYVRVVIGGTSYDLAKDDPSDDTYDDGVDYSKVIYLQPGLHDYYFTCSDWLYTDSTGTSSINVADAGNDNPPTLSGGEAVPVYGFSGITAFQFRVQYGDPDNNAPSYVRVSLNGTLFSLAKVDPSDTHYVDGCLYGETMTINVTGEYNYQFTASDGTYPASSPVFSDLVVSSRPPMYFNGMVYNYTSYFEISDTWCNQSVLVTAAGASRYLVNSTPDSWPAMEDRYVMDVTREITDDLWNAYQPGTSDWIRIYTDISIGSTVPLSIWQESMDQVFTVTGEAFIVAMGRTFRCWRLESAKGSVAYYDSYSGLLVSGRFISEMGGGNQYYYTIEINGTNVPLAPNTNAPVLSGLSVSPPAGDQGTLFNFSVTYTDADNDVPTSISFVLDGVEYPMVQVDPLDTMYTDGARFQYLTYLDPGTYSYKANCTDFLFTATTSTVSGFVVGLTNSFAPQLLSPAVSPAVGINTTSFNFTVVYKDADNNMPSFLNVTINSSTYQMVPSNPLDADAVDGKTYYYVRSLAWGTYTYRFTCSDGAFPNSTSWLTGPVVTPLMPYINVTLFSDDFEGDLSKWTTVDGLWHRTSTSSAWPNPCRSPTHSMWYGQETFGTYSTGSRTQGDMITIPFDLTISETAYLQFHHWRGCDAGNDRSHVYITTDGGATWFLLYENWTQNILPWERKILNISAYCGNSSVQVRFNFDTMNGWDNNYRGWLVDDVLVYTSRNDILPVSNFTANSTTILQHRYVQFTFTGSEGNPFASFLWNFGDGTPTSTLRNPVHKYTTAGNFTVSLRVNDADGDFNIMTKPNYIRVNPNLLPVANFTANATSIGIGQSVLFTFTGSAGDLPATYNWSFGDGTVNSSLQNPIHQYVSAGTFSVSLLVRDNNGDMSSLVRVAYITVTDYIPVANFTANVTQVYVNASVQFTYTGTEGNAPLAFQWDFGDGTGNSTDRNPIHMFSALGPHNVTVTVTDFDGDRSTLKRVDYILVVADLLPVATFTANVTTIYRDGWVQFTFTGFDGDLPSVLNWSFGDGTANDTINRNPLHQYTAVGNFTVTLWIRDDDFDVDTEVLTDFIRVIDRLPVANFTANVTSVGIGQNVSFTYTGTDGDPVATFQWSFDDGLGNSTDRHPTRSWASAGTYDVIVTVTDSDSDTSTMAKLNFIVVVDDLFPVAAFVVNSSRVEPGAWILFTFTGADGDTPATFQWNFGDGPVNGTARNPIHQYAAVGNFTVTLTVRDADGDTNTTQLVDCIIVTLKPVASFTANITTTGRNRWIQFTYTGTNGTESPTFEWDFGDGTPNSTAINPLHAYAAINDYTVTVTVQDGDGDTDVEQIVAFIRVINLIPVPDFVANVTELSEGGWVQFTFTGDEGDMPASEFVWVFGDGSPSVYTRDPAHQYTTQGWFTVVLTVKDSELDMNWTFKANFIHVIHDEPPPQDKDVLEQILDFLTQYWYIVVGGVAALVAVMAGAAAARKKSAAKAKLAGAAGKKGAAGARDGYGEPTPQLTHAQIIERLKHLFVFHRNSGVCLMYMPFDPLKKIDPQLIAGFLSAITSFGGTFDEKARLRVLDYQGFKILMEETEHCRHALMLEGEQNAQISDLFNRFIFEFENKYGNQLASFKGDVTLYTTAGDVIASVFQVQGGSTAAVEVVKPAPAKRPEKPAQAAPAAALQHFYCGTCQKWSDIPQGAKVTG
ncbi:MAG: PKD domain-containing protein, partial [Candidatus Lokiarchaeota archaeon]|nr:PKD domain-containing protein [Candidatus Lokiarchaeota archaeon]